MKARTLVIGGSAALALAWSLTVSSTLAPVSTVAAQERVDTRAFMKQDRLSCHNQQAQRSGAVPVALDNLDPANVERDAHTWEQIVRKMRAGVMPPSGMPRADKAVHERFLAVVEGELDRAARATPNPGRTQPFHRLNRTQYPNAVRDLLDLDIDVACAASRLTMRATGSTTSPAS